MGSMISYIQQIATVLVTAHLFSGFTEIRTYLCPGLVQKMGMSCCMCLWLEMEKVSRDPN